MKGNITMNANYIKEEENNRSGESVTLYIEPDKNVYQVWASLGPYTHILNLKNKKEARSLYEALLAVEYGSFE